MRAKLQGSEFVSGWKFDLVKRKNPIDSYIYDRFDSIHNTLTQTQLQLITENKQCKKQK